MSRLGPDAVYRKILELWTHQHHRGGGVVRVWVRDVAEELRCETSVVFKAVEELSARRQVIQEGSYFRLPPPIQTAEEVA